MRRCAVVYPRAWGEQWTVCGCCCPVVAYPLHGPVIWGDGSFPSGSAALCDELVDHYPEGGQVHFGGWGEMTHPNHWGLS